MNRYIKGPELEDRTASAEHNEILPEYIGTLRFPGPYCIEEGLEKHRYIDVNFVFASYSGPNGVSNRAEIRLVSAPKKRLLFSFLPITTANTGQSLTGDLGQNSKMPNKSQQPIEAKDAQLLFVFDGSPACSTAPTVTAGDVVTECKNFHRAISCLERLSHYVAQQIAAENPVFDCLKNTVTGLTTQVRQADPSARTKEAIVPKLIERLKNDAFHGFKLELPSLDASSTSETEASSAKRIMYLSYPLVAGWKDNNPKGKAVATPDEPEVTAFLQDIDFLNGKGGEHAPHEDTKKRKYVHAGYPLCAVPSPNTLVGLPQTAFKRALSRHLVLQPQFSLSIKLSSPKYSYALSLVATLFMLIGDADPASQRMKSSNISSKALATVSSEYAAMCEDLGIAPAPATNDSEQFALDYVEPQPKKARLSYSSDEEIPNINLD